MCVSSAVCGTLSMQGVCVSVCVARCICMAGVCLRLVKQSTDWSKVSSLRLNVSELISLLII